MIITQIRMDDAAGQAALQQFIFGGPYGGIRVPRGIDPACVDRYLDEALEGEVDSDDLVKVLEVLRFYERPEVLRAVRPMLERRPADYEGLRLHLVACQILADLGDEQDRALAARDVDTQVPRHPAAVDLASTILETYVVIAPAGDLGLFEAEIARIEAGLARNQNTSEAAMTAYDKIAAIRRNEVPRARARIDYKRKVVAMEPAARLREWVRIYMGESPFSDDFFQIWAARHLRRAVADDAGPAIWADLVSRIKRADPEKVGQDRATDVAVRRAASAVVYLGGRLTPAEQTLVDRAGAGTMDFLSDD